MHPSQLSLLLQRSFARLHRLLSFLFTMVCLYHALREIVQLIRRRTRR